MIARRELNDMEDMHEARLQADDGREGHPANPPMTTRWRRRIRN